jgi:hypothetical protein
MTGASYLNGLPGCCLGGFLFKAKAELLSAVRGFEADPDQRFKWQVLFYTLLYLFYIIFSYFFLLKAFP